MNRLPLLVTILGAVPFFGAPLQAQCSGFRRGDADADQSVSISDAVYTLGFLFRGGETPICMDAADANDDGRVDVTDPIFLLDHLFKGGSAPPPPGTSACGPDPTTDLLDCANTFIDWPSHLNWQVGRAWQFQTSASEGTYSEYVKGMAMKNGQSVYVVGWSCNWSDQLDYWYFDPNGAHMIGFYDEDTMMDVFISAPYHMPSWVEIGRQYTQAVQRGNDPVVTTTTYELLASVTVPMGTFNQVVKVTFGTPNETRVHYYATGVGQIMQHKTSSNRTDQLVSITNGLMARPCD